MFFTYTLVFYLSLLTIDSDPEHDTTVTAIGRMYHRQD